jgi:hypothetical protein
MSNTIKAQVATNNQSTERLETPSELTHDNSKDVKFLYQGVYYTLTSLSAKLFK